MTTAIATRSPDLGLTEEISRRWYPPAVLALGVTSWLA
jgi:hypothetical protein